MKEKTEKSWLVEMRYTGRPERKDRNDGQRDTQLEPYRDGVSEP